MPEKEFELYLSLLVKLLRLSPQQKTSIERELRDHFEERFELLVRRGIDRDAAIRQTLDEFGDVAGLASQFTSLSRRHIRRRIMQGTMATAGVAAAIVIWATLFRGPDPAVGPGPNVVAQEKPAVDEAPVPETAVVAADAPSVAETDVEWIDPGQFMPPGLGKPIDLAFTGLPLRQAIMHLQQTIGLNFLLDNASLSEEGITGDEEVSLSARGAPAYAVLDQLLRNVNGVELTWELTDDQVCKITTAEAAEYAFTTQYRNVRDLLDSGFTHAQLAEQISNETSGPWETLDGIGGAISSFGDLLIIRISDRVHPEVDCVLAALRSKAKIRRINEPAMHARLYAALDNETTIDVAGESLDDVIRQIGEQHHIPILLDRAALTAEGITVNDGITINVSGIKLRSALTLILDSIRGVEFDFLARDGVLWVTTRDVADSSLTTVYYNVEDITGDNVEQMDRLIGVVIAQTEGPWEQLDGTGGVIRTVMPGTFACRQTERAQAEVPAVLNVLRESLAASGGDRKFLTEEPEKLETRFYRMDATAADDLVALLPQFVAPGTWENQLVPETNELVQNGGSISKLSAGRLVLQLDSGKVLEIPAETSTAPDDSEAKQPDAAEQVSAQSNVVVIPQSILIITHKPSVQRKIKDVMTSLLSENSTWTGDRGGNVRFVAPGFQEGKWPDWNDPLKGHNPPTLEQQGGGGGGFGGGGFTGGGFGGAGGGFFSLGSP